MKNHLESCYKNEFLIFFISAAFSCRTRLIFILFISILFFFSSYFFKGVHVLPKNNNNKPRRYFLHLIGHRAKIFSCNEWSGKFLSKKSLRKNSCKQLIKFFFVSLEKVPIFGGANYLYYTNTVNGFINFHHKAIFCRC